MTTEVSPNPKRSEIWNVNLNPTIGVEIRKIRPVIVVNSDAVSRLPIRLVAPLTGWKNQFAASFWHVRIEPDRSNGLIKVSAVDTLQLRGLDTQRFVRKLGGIPAIIMEEIVSAIAAVVEYI